MVSKAILGITVIIALSSVVIFNNNSATAERDWNECVTKYDSKWGSHCKNCAMDGDTYKVMLRNTCTENIDVLCCVQEKYKNWKCYTHNNLAAQDTLYGYACQGNGKYLVWAKKVGDKQIKFPTVQEVNADYTD